MTKFFAIILGEFDTKILVIMQTSKFYPNYFAKDKFGNIYFFQIDWQKKICVCGLPTTFVSEGKVLKNIKTIVLSGGQTFGFDELQNKGFENVRKPNFELLN